MNEPESVEEHVERLLSHLRNASPPPVARFRDLDVTDIMILAGEFDSFTQLADEISLPGHTTRSHDLINIAKQKGVNYHDIISEQKDDGDGGEDKSSHPVSDSYWKARAEALEKDNSRLRDYYLRIGEVMRSVVPKMDPAIPEYPQNWSDDVDEELAIHALSDTHVGEKVTDTDTSGLSEFNMDVFVDRCEVYKEAVDNLINRHLRKTFPIRNAYVFYLGDLTSGEDVYPLQLAHVDRLLMEQIFEGAYYIADLFRFLCTIYDNVWAYMVPGNHGTGTKTTTLSTDYLLYTMVALSLADQKNFHPIISDSDYCAIYIDDTLDLLPFLGSDRRWNFCLTHGHQARSWMGIPYYGLDKLKRRISDAMKMSFDKVFAGHHHTTASTEGWELIGSWVGASDYSMRNQLASTPQQRLYGFHPKKGLTWRYNIFLGDPPSLPEGEDGIYTPSNRLLDRLLKPTSIEE